MASFVLLVNIKVLIYRLMQDLVYNSSFFQSQNSTFLCVQSPFNQNNVPKRTTFNLNVERIDMSVRLIHQTTVSSYDYHD